MFVEQENTTKLRQKKNGTEKIKDKDTANNWMANDAAPLRRTNIYRQAIPALWQRQFGQQHFRRPGLKFLTGETGNDQGQSHIKLLI